MSLKLSCDGKGSFLTKAHRVGSQESRCDRYKSGPPSQMVINEVANSTPYKWPKINGVSLGL